MNQHYILDLNSQASLDWDRCVLRNPLTGERPDLTATIAQAVGNQTGTYLIKINLEVEILEQNVISAKNKLELSQERKSPISSKPRLAS